MPSITTIIHTRNEELNIRDCIESAKLLSGTILVVDMESTDKTLEIAKKEGVQISPFPFTKYVEPARQFAIDKANTDWVFLLDADERMTKELADEIRSVIENAEQTHFKVKRKNIFGKSKWLQYGGWWPDYQLRLIRKDALESWPKAIHSSPKIKGNMGHLENAVIHFFHGNLETMVQKTATFEDIESDLLLEADRGVNILTFFRKFFGELYRRLVKHQGFRDGKIGILESIYQAYSKTVTYLYLYEKKNRRTL